MIALFPRPLSARPRPAFAISQSVLTLSRSPVLLAALWIGMSGIASAHSFTAALLVVGEDREVGLAEAVGGFLLAAGERDGHANETSDGHLGGVDVHVLPLPRNAAGLVEDLIGKPSEPPDLVVVLGPEPAASAIARAYQSEGIVLVQDVLPAGWEGESQMDSFAARYRLAHGTAPSAMAATAYHAARRLEAAIRPLDGVNPQAALEETWRSTELGLP